MLYTTALFLCIASSSLFIGQTTHTNPIQELTAAKKDLLQAQNEISSVQKELTTAHTQLNKSIKDGTTTIAEIDKHIAQLDVISQTLNRTRNEINKLKHEPGVKYLLGPIMKLINIIVDKLFSILPILDPALDLLRSLRITIATINKKLVPLSNSLDPQKQHGKQTHELLKKAHADFDKAVNNIDTFVENVMAAFDEF